MERIEEYARRVEQLYNLKKQEIKVKEDDEAKKIVNLVLQMFEASTKENNLLFNELTIKRNRFLLEFSFTVSGIEYTQVNVSSFNHIPEIAMQICDMSFNPKILYKAKEFYLEMAEKIPSYYVSKVETYSFENEVSSVTFGIGNLG